MPNDLSDSLVKLGPLGGFLVAVGYCAWPYVSPPRPPAPPPARMPKIEASWLDPDLKPASDRDPFRGTGSPPPPPALAASPGPAGPAGPAPRASEPERPIRVASRRVEPSPEFRLGATLVSGPRRAAIIDGKVYRQGDRFESAAGPWTVQWVEPGRVLLGRPRGRDPLILELPDPLSALTNSGSGPKPADTSRPGGEGPFAGLGNGLDLGSARAALAAVGVSLPAPDLLEQLASRSGGSVAGAYRALLGLLISPPRAASQPNPAGSPGAGTSGEANR
ncbi:hypothetical protein [Tautonia sociabilis]|uniref:Uncharacterized protein n=1 Tax=Tautonia sociabilis TaxID=2080755 RepID=A0A432MER1_9BACT|nr:hypothetical protein [Tautonia sociabilis]RUL84178.1 hypothetical protein TsocGM_20855 [Tautonia sociabilis]